MNSPRTRLLGGQPHLPCPGCSSLRLAHPRKHRVPRRSRRRDGHRQTSSRLAPTRKNSGANRHGSRQFRPADQSRLARPRGEPRAASRFSVASDDPPGPADHRKAQIHAGIARHYAPTKNDPDSHRGFYQVYIVLANWPFGRRNRARPPIFRGKSNQGVAIGESCRTFSTDSRSPKQAPARFRIFVGRSLLSPSDQRNLCHEISISPLFGCARKDALSIPLGRRPAGPPAIPTAHRHRFHWARPGIGPRTFPTPMCHQPGLTHENHSRSRDGDRRR